MTGAFQMIGDLPALTVPESVMQEAGLTMASKVDFEVGRDKVILHVIKEHPRAGWAEAAALIGAEPLTQDERDWLDFPNDADKDWTW